MNIFGVIFTRIELNQKRIESKEWQRILRHEYTHTKQMQELLYLPFYLWYIVEWLLKLIWYRNGRKAYRNISFEREAYAHEDCVNYNKERTLFAFLRYL